MRESKNIYEALNNINFNIDDYEKQEISDLEKKKIKRSFMKSRKKQYNFKKIGVIAAALALTIGILSQTDFTQSVYAATQSKISEISYSISQALGIERNIEPYLNVVNQVVEDKGIEVKLTEVIIDEGQLYFATIVDTGKPMDMIDFDYDIFINGKKIVNAGGGAASNSINDSGTIISTHYNRKIKDTKLTGNLDIRIVLKSLNYYENSIPKKMKGKWEFEFTANGAELTAETYKIPLNYSFNIGKEKYILEEFRYNPVSQNISGRIEVDEKGFSRYDLNLKGKDNLGNIVEFDSGSISVSDGVVLKRSRYYGDLDSKATSITLAPYIKEFPEKDGQPYVEEWKQIGEEFTVDTPGFYQIGIDAAHIAVGLRKRKGIFRFLCLL
jgi:hypothetical protein